MNYVNSEEFEELIGYKFKDPMLLVRALTHTSYANELKINGYGHYERLEFLGDAVLELVTSDYIYNNYPNLPEGKLSKLRASIVCEFSLSKDARQINLQKYILLGKGEEMTGGRQKDSIIADVMEAIIGAIYLDAGFDTAAHHIQKFILSDIDNKQLFYDSKTILQEYCQKKWKKEPTYEIIRESGPEHSRTFEVEVHMGDDIMASGVGGSKKGAEQQAAYEALLKMKINR